MKKPLRGILLALLGALVLIQFFQINKTNPPSDPAQDYLAVADMPAELGALLKDACYDCHSDQTKYPWYANVQPVGWWLAHHVDEGKGHLNFSVWTTYPPKKAAHKMEECFEVIESKEMPLKPYTITHGNARLSEEQRRAMAAWFRNEYAKMEAAQ